MTQVAHLQDSDSESPPPPQTLADFWLQYIVGGFICLHSLELGGFMARYFGEQYNIG